MPSRRQTRLTLFFMWWLNTLLGFLHSITFVLPDLADMSRFHHVAASCLVATYDGRTGKPRPNQGGGRITPTWLESLSDEQAIYYFRFNVNQIFALTDALRLPPLHRTNNGYVVTALEGVCLVLARYRRSGDLYDLTERYDRSVSAVSEIVNEFTIAIDEHWSHLLDFDPVLLSSENLERYAAAITRRGSPLSTIWGFIDCTIRQVCRLSIAQRIIYNGYKKFHALKFQAVMLPNGLIAHLFGPVEGRCADPHLLAASGLLARCWERATRPGTTATTPPAERYFQLFGDAAYRVSPIMMSPYTGRGGRLPSREQVDWNVGMSSVRIEVEHGFAVVLRLWPFLRCWWKHAVFGSPVGRYYRVGVLLTNAHTCMRGSQVSTYFNCDPPSLDEYFHT